MSASADEKKAAAAEGTKTEWAVRSPDGQVVLYGSETAARLAMSWTDGTGETDGMRLMSRETGPWKDEAAPHDTEPGR